MQAQQQTGHARRVLVIIGPSASGLAAALGMVALVVAATALGARAVAAAAPTTLARHHLPRARRPPRWR